MEKRKYKPLVSINGVRVCMPVWVAEVKEILFAVGIGIGIFALGTLFGYLLP